jgi:heat shock protein HtpX
MICATRECRRATPLAQSPADRAVGPDPGRDRSRRRQPAVGDGGLWLGVCRCRFNLLLEPAAASALTLRLYRARALHPHEAPEIWAVLRELAARAGLPAVPVPCVVNAFATGSKHHAAIALTDGLLRSLTPRELTGVLGHEIAHIANEDCVSWAGRFHQPAHPSSGLVGAACQRYCLEPRKSIGPRCFTGGRATAGLAGSARLVRVREFDADRLAAELTGDPHGLASALAKIERVSRSWRAWLLPGWGNPEPSWLRTHPATAERIQRLLELGSAARMPPFPSAHFAG